MKRLAALLLLAVLLLAGCAGRKITVDTEAKTITDGKNTYTYTDEITNSSRVIRIRYPNGGVYVWEKSWTDQGSSSTHNKYGAYDPVEYAYGEDLLDAILEVEPGPEIPNAPKVQKIRYQLTVDWPVVVMGVLVIGFGVWIVAKPNLFWNWGVGRWFKNGEPSDFALGRITLSGYIEVIMGVITVLIGIFL